MSKIHKRARIIIEVVVLLFLVALQASIIAVSSVDLEKYRPNILQSLEDALGGDVSLGEMEISLFPYIGVRAHDLLADGDGRIPHIKADEVVFGIYLTHLFGGDVVPKRVKIVSPEVTLKIEGDEIFGKDVFSSLGRSVPEEERRVGLREISITNASIVIEDERFSYKKRYETTIFYAWFRKNRERGPIRFSISMAPPGENGTGRIRCVGKYLDDGDLITKAWIKGADLATLNGLLFYGGDFSVKGVVSGEVDLRFKDKDNWELIADLYGDGIGISGLSYYPDGLNLDRIAVSGSLDLTPERFNIEDLVVSKGSLDAEVDLMLKRVKEGSGNRASLDLKSEISGFDIEDDISLIPFGLIPDDVEADLKALIVAGEIGASVRAKGDPFEMGAEGGVFEIKGSLEDASLDLGLVIVRGLSADISLSNDEILIENVAFKSPHGDVSELRWRVEDVFSGQYMRDFVVEVDEIGFEDVKDILASDPVDALPFLAPTEGVGEVRGWMNIDTPMGDTPGIPELLGGVDFFDWSISVPFLNATFEPTNASLTFEEEGMRISPVEFKFPNSLIRAKGNLLNYGKPLLIVSLDSPYMDLVELFGEGEGGNVLMLRDFSSRLIFEEGYVLLDNMDFSLYDGSCYGDWGYVYTEDEGEENEIIGGENDVEEVDGLDEGDGGVGDSIFFMNVKGEGVDMGAMFSDVGLTEEFKGRGDFEMSLKSDPGGFEAAVDTMDGNVKVAVYDGYFKKFGILSSVISMMNISNYLLLKFPKLETEGIPFESITGDFEIKDGIATTENLFVDSGVIRMSAVGSFDLTNGELDMVLGFQVLKTIDLILNKIPVVGYILTGDDGNLFTTYFKVGGTTDDPVVSTMTIQSLSEGTLNIFERIYNFPMKGFIPR